MKITHSSVTSSVFELVKTVELDLRLGEDTWTTRIELFRDTEQENVFRCHVWELELFRLRPTFPQNEEGEPAEISDGVVMVERGIARSEIASRVNTPFNAPDANAALEMIIDDLKKFLEHTILEEAR